MKVKKGQLVFVKHSRSGNWHGVAYEDFDTEKDEWYPLKLAEVSREGLNTQWVEGEEMPARRGLCKVQIVTGKPKRKLKVSEFGKDHWSLFAYVETRCVDYMGKLDPNHMRADGDKYPTKLKGYFKDKKNPNLTLEGHSDWDCLNDLQTAGFIKIIATLPDTVELTEKGYKAVAQMRRFKCEGGQYADFTLKKNA